MMVEATNEVRYQAPGWSTRNLMHRLVRRLARMGVSVWGRRELRIVGRSSGQTRTTVVNLLDHEGHQYLVAPRGETQWVKNIRAAGGGELRVGRHMLPFRAVELDDGQKVAVLRDYLRRWKFEVGQFFQGVGPDAPDDDRARITSAYPG